MSIRRLAPQPAISGREWCACIVSPGRTHSLANSKPKYSTPTERWTGCYIGAQFRDRSIDMCHQSRRVLIALLVLCASGVVRARQSELQDEAGKLIAELVESTPAGAVIGVGQTSSADGAVTRLSVRIAELYEEALVQRASETEYRVVERVGLEELTREWALGQSGAVEEQTAAAAGKLSGVSHFVFGSYTAGDERLAIRARLVDAESGSIVASESAELRLDKETENLARAPIHSSPPPKDRPAGELAVDLWTDKGEYRCGDTLRFNVRANRD
ncbi:MAG: hypothetical protein GF331_22065, partial [Chitinivibrionales bacterium]|nr:hypothetical protein [Chitinivibrionales bacterium]